LGLPFEPFFVYHTRVIYRLVVVVLPMEIIEGIDSWSPHTMPKCQMLEMEMPNGKSIVIGFSGIWIITGKLIDNYNWVSLDPHRVMDVICQEERGNEGY
jgi:hypothetical protein